MNAMPVHKNPLLVRAYNLLWEIRLGISTNGSVDIQFPDAYEYATMRYSTINRILKHLRLQPSDVLVDLGSGKGRVLCCAARFAMRKVVGVELSKEMYDAATLNVAKMRGRKSPITIHHTTAQEFDYSEGTVFTLFNPFGASTLASVLEKLGLNLQTNPRCVTIAYANPEHDDVFARMKWLERYAHWDKDKLGMEHSVSFYKSLPLA